MNRDPDMNVLRLILDNINSFHFVRPPHISEEQFNTDIASLRFKLSSANSEVVLSDSEVQLLFQLLSDDRFSDTSRDAVIHKLNHLLKLPSDHKSHSY